MNEKKCEDCMHHDGGYICRLLGHRGKPMKTCGWWNKPVIPPAKHRTENIQRNKLAKTIVSRLLGSLEANSIYISLIETLLCGFESSIKQQERRSIFDFEIDWNEVDVEYKSFMEDWQEMTAPSTKDAFIHGFLTYRSILNKKEQS